VALLSARQFDQQLTRFAASIPAVLVPRLTTAVSLACIRGFVFLTRVKTGRARGGWQLGIGSEPTASELPLDKNGGSTVDRAAGRLRAGATAQPFAPVFITNNVVYILILNDKLGDKMIERTLAQVAVAFP
jgi:hypothetical protein